MVKSDAGGEKGKLLCCKRIFDRIKANLAEIQLKKHQNVQKTHFLQKVPGVNGLKYFFFYIHFNFKPARDPHGHLTGFRSSPQGICLQRVARANSVEKRE